MEIAQNSENLKIVIYSFYLLVNNARMNVKMKVPCVIAFVFICFKGVVCETCGNLNYSQPAFKGRYVTITFKPFKFSASESLTISYSNVVKPWTAVPSTVMYNATLGVFTTVFDTNIPNSGYLHIYAKYGQCSSQSIRLDLQDLSGGCGYIYLRTPNPVLGKKVEIGYYPAPAVIGLTGEYSREWYNESSRSSMTLTEGLLTEEELPNKEFVLTIYSATRWTTGSYSVKCTESSTNRLSTDRVYVKVTVPPGQPFLQSTRIVQDCPKCLVVILGLNMFEHVFCNTSGGTLPYIYLDDVEYKVYRNPPSGNIYRISRFIRAEDHMKTVTCSVFNAALEKPLTTSAKLFVALKPEIPVLNVPILREGSPANITCISRGGRPAANLSLWLDGKYASVDHVKTNDNPTTTYTTTITFNDPARKDWNGKYVSCLSSSPLFGGNETQRKTINCKYPPSTLTMDARYIPSYLQYNYTLKFTCLTDTYNDFCWISWTKDDKLLNSNRDGTDKIQDSSLMEFAKVSKENNGQTITCIVNCSNFDVQLSKSHSVQVPYKPSVHLSVEDEVLLNAHDTTSVTCTANSLPLSDIVWSVNGDTQLLVCNKSLECEIHTLPIESDEHRNYTCTAYFEFGDYDTIATVSFLAIGRASKQKPYEIPNESEDASLTNSNGIPIVWIVIGLGVIIAIVIISTVIVLVRKRFLKKNQHVNSSEPQPVQHAVHVQGNETVAMNEEVTYAQVNKIRTEAVGPKSKEGSDTNLVYADIDIEHLETASKPPSRQRPPSPTEYADVDFIRTEHGSNSDNITI